MRNKCPQHWAAKSARDSNLEFSSTTPDTDSSLKWMNSEEAARFLKVSRQMLWNMTSNGVVPHYKLGRSNRYRLDELEALLLKSRRGSHGN